MTFFAKDVNALEEADLQWLIDTKFAEASTIEYKSQLKFTTNEEIEKVLSQKINTDGTDSPTGNDSDVFISYDGCGCAGSKVTTIEGELVPEPGTSNFRRRKQKVYEDSLGRPFKLETYNWDGTNVYSTVVKQFNGRDQVTELTQITGTSGTAQATTSTYDGHGRLRTNHRPEQIDDTTDPDTPTHTTYNYNGDDSISSVVDGRGVTTSYTYNNKALVDEIEYTVPGGSGITDPGDVNFSYDNLGNRTQMIDGMGTVNYTYTSLSQVASETRYFTDTLTHAPISGNGFALSYTYTLTGQPKTYTDPYGQEITYAYDKTGRVNTVTGSSYGGITNYASNPKYQAWGALKHLDYGNGVEMDAEYNSRLQATAFEVNKPSTSTVLMKKTYDYYADGQLKMADDQLGSTEVSNRLDRLFKYDHLGRVKEAKSGLAAHGGTPTNAFYQPYNQSYTYNALGNLTGRSSTLWNYTNTNWNFSYTTVNNRTTDSGYTYDAEGNQTAGDDINFEYDATGMMSRTWRTDNYETTRARSGDGVEAKRTQRAYDADTSSWGTWESRYFVFSSVLGGNIAEVDTTGKKKLTYVLGGGNILARQHLTGSTESVEWEHRDAVGLSTRSTAENGTLTGENDEELDGLGNNVGVFGTLTMPNPPAMSGRIRVPFGDMEMGDCEVDGMLQSCSSISRESLAVQVTYRSGRTATFRPDFSMGLRGRGLNLSFMVHYSHTTPAGPDTPDNPDTPEDETVIRVGSTVDWWGSVSINVQDPIVPLGDVEARSIKLISENKDCANFIKNLLDKVAKETGRPHVENPFSGNLVNFSQQTATIKGVKINVSGKGFGRHYPVSSSTDGQRDSYGLMGISPLTSGWIKCRRQICYDVYSRVYPQCLR